MTHLCEYFFKKIFISTNYLVSVNLSNIRFLGPHSCCRGSPFHSKLGPHWVPIKNTFGPHAIWEVNEVKCNIGKTQVSWDCMKEIQNGVCTFLFMRFFHMVHQECGLAELLRASRARVLCRTLSLLEVSSKLILSSNILSTVTTVQNESP